ncbi:MAG: VWA domain-containing protein [Gaiellaceae bacterium]
MRVTFLTPEGGLLALGALLPLAGLLAVSRRAGTVRRALALAPRPRRRLVLPVAAALAASALLGLAAAQPVLARTTTLAVRTDAQVFVVVDVSRSMLASLGPGGPTRLSRAKAVTSELREELSGIPVGLASLTDRTLPHLFPSADEDVFRATLARSIGIEQPPPRSTFSQNATSFDSLADVATRRFFSSTAERRLLVVLTDGESTPITAGRVGRLLGRASVRSVFVHLWDPAERVYTNGRAEPQYRPDPSGRTLLEALAVATGGSVYSEAAAAAAARKSRELLGSGPTRAQGVREARSGLAAYLALAALLPVGLLLARPDR